MATDAIEAALERARQGPSFELYRLNTPTDEQRAEQLDIERAPAKDVPLGEQVGAALELESYTKGLTRFAVEGLEFQNDDNYVPPAFDSPEFKTLAGNVPPEYWSRLATARSGAHAEFIKDQILTELDASRKLEEAGWSGTTLRIATSVLDPVSLSTILLTGGSSVIMSGTRAARAAKLGLAAGAENVALETALYGTRETKDADDLYVALIGGIVAGGALGAVLPAASRAKLYGAGKRLQDGEPDLSLTEDIAAAVDGSSQSVGAAKATVGVRDLGDAPAPEVLNAPKLTGAEAKVRYDWHAQLAKSDNPYARFAGDKLLADPVGRRNTAQTGAAEEYRRYVTRRSMTKFAQAAYPAADEALQGVPILRRAAAEDEFYHEVTMRAIREEFDDTPVGRAATGMADAIETSATAAKRHGVVGFEDLEIKRGYVPHIPSGPKLQRALDRFGSDQVEAIVAGAFSRSTGVEAKYAARVARGYVTGIRNRHAGIQGDFSLALADKELLADLMRKAGVEDADVSDVLRQLKAFEDPDTSKAGKMARAKSRLDFDETYVAKLKDHDGTYANVSIMELFETDARFLTSLYTSTVGGHAAMARAGFKGQADWDKFIRDMRAYEPDRIGDRGSQVDKEIKLLENARTAILGRPLIDYTNTANAALFAARDWAFVAQSGSFWAAQGSELMTVMTSGGLKMTLDAVPEMKAIFTRAADGTLEHTVARELEDLLAPGVDALLDSVLGRFSVGVEEGAVNIADKLKKTYGARHTLKKAAGYANLLTPLTTGMQRVQAVFAAQRIVNELAERGGKGFSEMRLRTLGLDPAMEKRVADQIKANVRFEPSAEAGRQIPRLNAEKWTDLDARDAFALAIQRETDRNVLTPTLGGSIPVTRTSEAGKALTQFMTFALQAHSRILLHGVKHMDAERFTGWLLGTGMAAMLYVARTHLEAAGKKNKHKYLRERLSPDEIAKAAFARAGFSALIPTAYDTAAQMLPGIDPVFSHARTSGLGSGLANARNNPAGSAVFGAVDVIAAFDDGRFTEREWRSLQRMLPFARVLGIQQGLEVLGNELPSK